MKHSSRNSSLAVVLLAHGTKEKEASAPVFEYAKILSERMGGVVKPCFREFIEPRFSHVTSELAQASFTTIIVLPLFLFSSGHVTRDILLDVEKEREKFPSLQFLISEPIGFDVALVEILERRLKETMEKMDVVK